jgi:hypothetical protein
MRAASCSMMSSSVRAPGKTCPYWDRNPLTSGSPPDSRSWNHVAIRGQALRRDALDGVRETREVRVQHLLAQLVEQGLESISGLGLQEVVVRQAADSTGNVFGNGFELALAALGQ